MDWLKIDRDNLESDSDLHWSKLGKVANADGRKKKLIFYPKKKNPENNGEVVNTWVFQAGSPWFDS